MVPGIHRDTQIEESCTLYKILIRFHLVQVMLNLFCYAQCLHRRLSHTNLLHLPPRHLFSNTQQGPLTGTQTRSPCPSTSDTPPHTYQACNPPRPSPSHPTPPSTPYSRPPSSGSSSPQSQRGTPRRRGWRRARPSRYGCGAAFGSARCESGWSVWGGAGCGARRGRGRAGLRTSFRARGLG